MSDALHVCPDCRSELVQPLEWKQADGNRGHWHLLRRCPECEWRGGAIYGPHEIDAYDDVLDDGSVALVRELRTLEQEAMSELADTLAEALELDLIGADDFAV